MNDLVSVIMPVFNAEKYLKQTLESLLNQEYANWELIVVDDKSKDGSLSILREFSKKEPRIVLIEKEQNSGSADSRNKGIDRAGGRFIAFLDADDLWDPDFLSSMTKYMTENDSAFSFASYRIIDESGNELTKPFLIENKKYNYFDMLLYNRVGLLTAMYDVSKIGKMHFDVSLKSLRDDYALWLDILGKSNYGLGYQGIIASYRVHSNAMTSNKKRVFRAHYNMLRKHAGHSILPSFFFTSTHFLNGFRKYILNKL